MSDPIPFGLGAATADEARRIEARHAITAPEPGMYVLDHRADFIELWRVDGTEPELVDLAVDPLPKRKPGQYALDPVWE